MRGTFCGSLAHADPAAEWCLLAATLDAELIAVNTRGERRIAARDFFEVWLDRETAGADLDSLGVKMQLARRLGETVARIHDPLMRSEVASRVSARPEKANIPARPKTPRPT